MLRFLSALFAPDDHLSHIVHYHLDEQGERRFCDESACHPAKDRLTPQQHLLFPPYR